MEKKYLRKKYFIGSPVQKIFLFYSVTMGFLSILLMRLHDYIIMIAGSNFQIARQFGAIVALSLVGMVLFWIMSWIERRSLPWHISSRSLQK